MSSTTPAPTVTAQECINLAAEALNAARVAADGPEAAERSHSLRMIGESYRQLAETVLARETTLANRDVLDRLRGPWAPQTPHERG